MWPLTALALGRGLGGARWGLLSSSGGVCFPCHDSWALRACLLRFPKIGGRSLSASGCSECVLQRVFVARRHSRVCLRFPIGSVAFRVPSPTVRLGGALGRVGSGFVRCCFSHRSSSACLISNRQALGSVQSRKCLADRIRRSLDLVL